MTAALVIALLFGLIFLAMPVSFAMFVAGIVGLWWEGGWHVALGVLKTSPYQAAASYTLTTFPMFVLMAEVMGATRITGDLFRAANGWLGHLRGGLAYAAVFGGTMLAARPRPRRRRSARRSIPSCANTATGRRSRPARWRRWGPCPS